MSAKQHYKKILTLASIGVLAIAINEARAQSTPDDFFSGASSVASPAAKSGGSAMPAFNAKRMSNSMGTPSDQLVGKLSQEIFQEMVDLERDNAVLALQLKREELQSKIEDLKASQRDKIMEEIERREELARARIEWEKDQEIKVLESRERLERQRIREKQIDAVIARNEEERRIRADEEKRKIEEEQERKLQAHLEQIRLMNEAENARKEEAAKNVNSVVPAITSSSLDNDQFWGGSAATDVTANAPDVSAPTVNAPAGSSTSSASSSNSSAGNDVPSNAIPEEKKDDKAEEKKDDAGIKVDIAGNDGNSVVVDVPEDPKASDNYYLIEVRGLGDDLVAKLSDKANTQSFYVRVGSTLGTGHEVTAITGEYVEAKLNDKVDQVTFTSGGIAYRPAN